MSKKFELVWGIDISKEWLDISIDRKVSRIDQTKKAINQFIKKNYVKGKNTLAVVENTGGYEVLAVNCLDQAGITVHIAHPNKVRNYAKARGKLAKTDKLDAQMIEGYGRFIDVETIRAIPTPSQRRLAALNARLAQLKEAHQQEACRLGMAKETSIKQSHEALMKVLKKQINGIKKQLVEIVMSDTELRDKYTLLTSMKGVGETVALALLADLPELGHATKKEIVALVGVAPITRESGKYAGKAMTQGGRDSLRRVLYMGALVAARCNDKLSSFYQHLVAKGKPKKVALVAVMRKMLVILNAMVQSNSVFNA